MKNSGKQFESDFNSSIDTSHCFIYRLKDTAQAYNNNSNTKFTWDNPCDFFIYDSNSHLFYALELKSTKYKSISFQTDKNDDSSKMLKYHQIQSLTEMSKYDGIISGLILNFRDEKNDCQRTYFISIDNFNKMRESINKTSCNELDILTNHGVKIYGEKKRVHFRWNMDEFFINMNKENNKKYE